MTVQAEAELPAVQHHLSSHPPPGRFGAQNARGAIL